MLRALLRALAALVLVVLAIPVVVIAVSWFNSRSTAYDTPAYRGACHGPPLRSVGNRETAMTEGYEIDRRFDCISKSSYASVQEAKARWAAENTPEAKARRQAEWAAAAERGRAERQAEAERLAREEREANERRAAIAASPPPLPLRDVNTASESELAEVLGLDAATAARIVAERQKARFRDWADLVHRVVGLSAAQPAAIASTGGLTVNGQSLPGAPPDAVLTALEKDARQRLKR